MPLATPGRLTAVVALGWALVVGIASQGDPRTLLALGDRFSHPPALAGAPTRAGTGYDGQFYAGLATDPLVLHPDTAGHLDSARYRAGRIGLPLLAWLLAAGNGAAAVLVYQLLCWAGAILGVWAAARWLQDEGASPLWALPLAASAGVVASILRSLPDAAAVSLVLVALWLHRRARPGAAVAVLAFACLVRETSLLAAAALALHEASERRLGAAAVSALVPLVVVGAWKVWVASRPGMAGTLGFHNLDLPMKGVWDKLVRPLPPIELLGVLVLALAIAAVVALRRPWSPLALTYVGFAAMTACLAYVVVEEVYAYTRVTAFLPVGAAVLAGGAGSSADRRWALRAVPLAYAVLGAGMLAASSPFRQLLVLR
jgi:hypothetical protein